MHIRVIYRVIFYEIKIMLEKFKNEIINERKYFRDSLKRYDICTRLRKRTHTYAQIQITRFLK